MQQQSLARRAKSTLIGDRAFYRTVLMIVIPIIIQNAITNFVSLLDNIMVGQVGTVPMSGVSIVNGLLFVFNLCIFGCSSGAGIFTAQYHGSGDQEGVRNTFRFKILSCIALALVGIGIFYFGGQGLIGLYLTGEGDPQEAAGAMAYGLSYLQMMLLGLIPFALCNAYSSTLRETGETMVPMLGGIAAVLGNLGLNYVLIFGKLGLPALGITGAAVATLLSRVVEFVVAFSYAFRCRTMPLMKHAILRPGMDMLRKFLRYSAPVLINETLWGTGFSMITVIMGHMANSSDLIAAYTLAGNIDKLMTSGVFGIAAAVSVIVGKEIGTGNLKGVYNIGRALCFTAFAFGIVLGLAEYTMFVTLMRPFVMPLFSLSAVAERLCSVMLMCYACAIPLHSFSTTMVVGVLRGGGDVNASLVIDNFPLWCGTLPVMCLLGLVLKVPNEVFCLCLMIEYIIKSPIGLYRLHSGKWIHDITRIDE